MIVDLRIMLQGLSTHTSGNSSSPSEAQNKVLSTVSETFTVRVRSHPRLTKAIYIWHRSFA